MNYNSFSQIEKLQEDIISILKKEKISFTREKTFKDLRNGKFRFDFYISNYQGKEIIIEVDGE